MTWYRDIFNSRKKTLWFSGNICMPREGFRDILNHRGARARIRERERCLSLFWFRCLWHVGLWESGASESMVTGHHSAWYLTFLMSSSYKDFLTAALSFMFSIAIVLCRALLSRLFSLRSVHCGHYSHSPSQDFFSLAFLGLGFIIYL